MTAYTMSVVQLCPDQYKDIANAVAEERGYGPNNLSVKLVREIDGSIWWGCRADWIESVFHSQMTIPPETPTYIVEALSSVISSAKENVDPNTHWLETIQEYGMTLADVEIAV